MNHFEFRDGELYAENVAISKIAQEVGTPFYCYSTATLEHHYKVLAGALDSAGIAPSALLCFSVKANSNLAVLSTLAACGAGADIVSGGELKRALKAGIPAERIVFSGVGKTRIEMRQALEANIAQFNVESLSELHELSQTAEALGLTAPIAFRVNPDIDAGTHEKISTGKAEDKFGVAWDDVEHAYQLAADLPNIDVVGIDIHIGSQITNLDPFRKAFEKVAGLLAKLREQGHDIRNLDLGGGLGVPYQSSEDRPPSVDEYAQVIGDTLGASGCQIILEPGRMIAGNAGIIVTSVIREKRGQAKNFLIVDAAMTELMRPTLYGAFHEIQPIVQTDKNPALWDIVGPVCESGDFIGKERHLPTLEEGDLLAIFTSGAYAAVQGSTYNTRPLAPEVLVRDSAYFVARARPSVDDLLARETMPDWS